MVKVSITLPNAAQITLESEESEVIQQVVSMALRDLPRELMRSGAALASTEGSDVTTPASAPATLNVVQEAGRSIVETASPSPIIDAPEPEHAATSGLASGPAAATPGQARTSRRSAAASPARPLQGLVDREHADGGNVGRQSATRAPTRSPTRSQTTEAEKQFSQFCAAAAPMGDMRKVVVAAEGAKRFLDMASVDATDLAGLFDLAGWLTPHNFIQTLRNAARDKYRWLERIPGRSGRYSATELGRTITSTE